jgi:hypothetical protein
LSAPEFGGIFDLSLVVPEEMPHASRQTGIATELDFPLSAARLPSKLEITAIRVAHEALINVALHADGSGPSSRWIGRDRGGLRSNPDARDASDASPDRVMDRLPSRC